MNVARVAVNYPLKNSGLLYFYEGELVRGQVVEVPLRNRLEWGCVVSVDESTSKEFLELDHDKIKPINSRVDDWILSESELQLYEWIASYYHYGLGQVIFDCIPKTLKLPRSSKNIIGEGRELDFALNSRQQLLVDEMAQKLGSFSRFLVHGVTGSGKSAVYLELIRRTLKDGKSVLFLLPEINLTPQFTEFFARYIGHPIYSYHSELSEAQKYLAWKTAKHSPNPLLLLGVRSSIFIPVNNLGLIIIDEEHDTSFKQDDRCPYNARDVASKKAQLLNIPLIMGSATPSLESYNTFHQVTHSTQIFEMRERAGDAYLPTVELVDARDSSGHEADTWPLAPRSVEVLTQALARGEQVLVFVNRLGFASFIQCRACGHQFNCPNCSLTLRYYKRKNSLACQHCDYKGPYPQQCPECACMTLSQKGFGTEKIQEVLQRIFPEKTIERFDRDEIKTFKQLEKRLDDFHQGKIEIMVGTQMLSKGHNFENVKLVLILGIDSQLNFPDFRSSERVYQTLTQVSGRAGRYSQDGKVLIQTLNPENRLFQLIQKHDFGQFYEEELKIRQICECPPFFRLALIHFTSRFQEKLISHVTDEVAPTFRSLIRSHFPLVTMLGPRPAPVEKKANQFTWSVLFKTKDIGGLHNLLKTFEVNYRPQHSISYKIDIDPYTMV
jgi:primosomal protein N' (replication factor Y) (superfamily II helicase)